MRSVFIFLTVKSLKYISDKVQPYLYQTVYSYMNQQTKIITTICAATLFILSLTSCGGDNVCIKGNNNIQTRTINLPSFNEIALLGSFDIVIKQGNTRTAVITGDENVIQDLQADVSNSVCDIRLKKGCYKNYKLKIEITTPIIEGIQIEGSSDVSVSDFTNQARLDLSIEGSGDINFSEFEGLQLGNFRINGSGDIHFLKDIIDARQLNINISGSGNFKGYRLMAKNVSASISGSGNIQTYPTEQLKAQIAGSGDIRFKGNPQILKKITGSGNVSPK